MIFIILLDNIDGEVGDNPGKGTDNEADDGVENGVFGSLGFGCFAGGSHILDATDNDDDETNHP